MKQILSSIGILIFLALCCMADIDLGAFADGKDHWDASQQEPCPEFEIPEHLTDGTDMNCALAARAMLHYMNSQKADCLEITNKGWVPVNNRILSRNEIEYLVALNGAPESRELDELPCELCPFDELSMCPKCVEIHEEAYRQMSGSTDIDP